MIKSNNGYDKLKTVIVGRELELQKRVADITFKVFYKQNLGESIYDSFEDFSLNSEILQERIEDLDGLAKTLEGLGVHVYRPNIVDKVYKIKTPTFETELSSPSNVRDITFVYQNKIIETPINIRNRYFENINLNHIFYKEFNPNNTQWIKSPHQFLTEDSLDLMDWDAKRDFENPPKFYEMAIDGAHFMRINEHECFVNISTYSHYLGYQWVKSFFNDVTFYPIFQLIDNHLDGAFVVLNEGTFLVNPKYPNLRYYLPNKFKNWKFIYSGDTSRKYPKNRSNNLGIQIASERGMDMNVLSTDPKTVIVNEDAVDTIKALESNKFDVIPIQFRHSEAFGGGLHCSTLDLWREE